MLRLVRHSSTENALVPANGCSEWIVGIPYKAEIDPASALVIGQIRRSGRSRCRRRGPVARFPIAISGARIAKMQAGSLWFDDDPTGGFLDVPSMPPVRLLWEGCW